MAKPKTTADRFILARALIQKARDLPVPGPPAGKFDFSYIAQVKDLLRQARDLVKFLPDLAGADDELKAEVQKIFDEADQANKEILL